MKKKILIALVLSLLAVMVLATPILADDASVTVSDVTVSTPIGNQGDTVTASGSVTVVANASSNVPFLPDNAVVSGEATYTVYDPNGHVVATGSLSKDKEQLDKWIGSANVHINYTYDWETSFLLRETGLYTVTNYGNAIAESWAQFLWWKLGYEYTSVSKSKEANIYSCLVIQYPDWYGLGGFTVYVNNFNQYQNVPFTSPISRVLSKGINYSTDGINVVIPEGTVVNKDGCAINQLGIKYLNGKLSFETQNIKFSNPVVITDMYGKVLYSFTELVNGVPNNLVVPELVPVINLP